MTDALYVVRDRMGKVIGAYTVPQEAGKVMARLEPGAFVAQGPAIVAWHSDTTDADKRDIRAVTGMREGPPSMKSATRTPERDAAMRTAIVPATEMTMAIVKCREPGCENPAGRDGKRADLNGLCNVHKQRIHAREYNARAAKSEGRPAPKVRKAPTETAAKKAASKLPVKPKPSTKAKPKPAAAALPKQTSIDDAIEVLRTAIMILERAKRIAVALAE